MFRRQLPHYLPYDGLDYHLSTHSSYISTLEDRLAVWHEDNMVLADEVVRLRTENEHLKSQLVQSRVSKGSRTEERVGGSERKNETGMECPQFAEHGPIKNMNTTLPIDLKNSRSVTFKPREEHSQRIRPTNSVYYNSPSPSPEKEGQYSTVQNLSHSLVERRPPNASAIEEPKQFGHHQDISKSYFSTVNVPNEQAQSVVRRVVYLQPVRPHLVRESYMQSPPRRPVRADSCQIRNSKASKRRKIFMGVVSPPKHKPTMQRSS